MTRASVTIPGLPPRPNARRTTRGAMVAVKRWRMSAWAAVRAQSRVLPLPLGAAEAHVRVTLTRARTRGPAMGTDSLAASFKAVRDGVAGALFSPCAKHGGNGSACGGQHDDDPRIEWVYRQGRTSAGAAFVCIDVEWHAGRAPAAWGATRIDCDCVLDESVEVQP